MIINIILSLCDGISFLYPFHHLNDTDTKRASNAILLVIYTLLNTWISMADPMSDLVKDLLLFFLTCLLIVLYLKRLRAFDLMLYFILFTISNVCILSVYLLSGQLPNILTAVIAQGVRFTVFYFLTAYLEKNISLYSSLRVQEMLLIMAPLLVLFEVLYLRYLVTQDTYMLIELAASIIACIGVFLLIQKYYLVNGQFERQKMMNKALDLSRKSLQENRQKQIETQKIHHDMSARLLTIQALIQSNKMEEANKCIAESLNDVQNTKSVIYCPIDTVNNLFNYKVAEYPDITFHIDSRCDCEQKIDVMDLSIIFANLIDNAAREIREHHLDPVITLKIRQNNVLLVISCSNELSQHKDLKTDRLNAEDHGLGLMIVNELVEKYDGTISIEQTHLFTVTIMLNGVTK